MALDPVTPPGVCFVSDFWQRALLELTRTIRTSHDAQELEKGGQVCFAVADSLINLCCDPHKYREAISALAKILT